jgi:hypothetical protein
MPVHRRDRHYGKAGPESDCDIGGVSGGDAAARVCPAIANG